MSHLDSLSFILVSDAQKRGIVAFLKRLPEILTGLGTILEKVHLPISWRLCRISEATEMYSLTAIRLSNYE